MQQPTITVRNAHGAYTASADAVDAAMEQFLPASPAQLRAIVEERHALEGGASDVHTVSEFVIMLADTIQGEWDARDEDSRRHAAKLHSIPELHTNPWH